MGILQDLEQLEHDGRPIRVAVAGAGQMGTDIICQMAGLAGMDVLAVAELHVGRARNAFLQASVADEQIVEADSVSRAAEMLARGRRVIVGEVAILPRLEHVDVVVDATGIPHVGADLAWQCILNKKHIVTLNVEADVTVGAILEHLAEGAGVVYTGSAGDEPAATLELVEFARTLGFDVVAAGKGKNNPLDHAATPESLAATASARGMGAKMLTSFVDGTKTMVEMTALSNATGLVPDVSGMHGPTVDHFRELAKVFSIQEEGGILSKAGVVDYALGDIAPGVFVVFRSDSRRVENSLQYSKMGPGPNHVLYRPYHLVSLETPMSVARAWLRGEATIVCRGEPVSETVSVAKRDLAVGEKIDGIGGSTVYGWIETVEETRAGNLVPIGVVAGAKLTKAARKGTKLTYDIVEVDRSSTIHHLRQLQDSHFSRV